MGKAVVQKVEFYRVLNANGRVLMDFLPKWEAKIYADTYNGRKRRKKRQRA